MGLDFPNSPATGQLFPSPSTTGVTTWIWDGSEWTVPPLIPKVVTVNAVGTELHTTSGTSLAYTGLTIAAGTNRALVATIMWDSGSVPTGVTMTWDSGGANQAMTRIIASGSYSELWGLVNPVVGNKTLSVSWTTAVQVFIAAIAFNGVDQTGGVTSFPNSVTGNVVTLNVTSAVGDMVVSCGSCGVGVVPTGTTIFYDAVHGSTINAYANYDNGAPTVAIGTNIGGGQKVATDVKAG